MQTAFNCNGGTYRIEKVKSIRYKRRPSLNLTARTNMS